MRRAGNTHRRSLQSERENLRRWLLSRRLIMRAGTLDTQQIKVKHAHCDLERAQEKKKTRLLGSPDTPWMVLLEGRLTDRQIKAATLSKRLFAYNSSSFSRAPTQLSRHRINGIYTA